MVFNKRPRCQRKPFRFSLGYEIQQHTARTKHSTGNQPVLNDVRDKGRRAFHGIKKYTNKILIHHISPHLTPLHHISPHLTGLLLLLSAGGPLLLQVPLAAASQCSVLTLILLHWYCYIELNQSDMLERSAASVSRSWGATSPRPPPPHPLMLPGALIHPGIVASDWQTQASPLLGGGSPCPQSQGDTTYPATL